MTKTAVCFLAAVFAAEVFGSNDWTRADWTMPDGVTRDGNVLTVALDRPGSAMATVPVDLSRYAGTCIRVTIRVSAKDLARGPQPWLGYKFMFSYRDGKSGDSYWPGAASRAGTFDWEESEIVCDLRDCRPEAAKLSLGIQDARGCVRFDLASLKIEQAKPLFPENDSDAISAYSPRLDARPVKRGVMLPAEACRESDFQTLHAWGVKLARYQIMRGWGKVRDNADVAEYAAWVDSKIDHLLKDVLPWAEKYDIDIVVDLHVAPGGVDETSDMVMFHEARYAQAFVDVWRAIARRCKGRPRIWGYDLINEPQQSRVSRTGDDYRSLQVRAAEAVREIDPKTPIVIESNGACAPGTYGYLRPLDMKDVIYQVHVYGPLEYTHQGVHATSPSAYTPVAYPNAGKSWSREGLKAMLEPVRKFQLRHCARIYVGEFSAIALAEGADRYLADCISIFEEYGWDWTYHSFREWHGWDIERDGDGPLKTKPSADNPRKRALLDGFTRSAAKETLRK